MRLAGVLLGGAAVGGLGNYIGRGQGYGNALEDHQGQITVGDEFINKAEEVVIRRQNGEKVPEKTYQTALRILAMSHPEYFAAQEQVPVAVESAVPVAQPVVVEAPVQY